MTTVRKNRPLRSGYTTGACAAAAAKAAALLLFTGKAPARVTITFPDASHHTFPLHDCRMLDHIAMASVIKDAGDDPDVTNRAEIGVELHECIWEPGTAQFRLQRGEGVGMVTKPGLAVPVGEPAINPAPRKMITQAIEDAFTESGQDSTALNISVFVRNGEKLAKHTLNQRLGILGGLSILGTTGIVRPVSAQAWTDTIEASMSVGRAAGQDTVILSTGRTSEKAVQDILHLPEEAQVMMGDYLLYALEAAKRQGFTRIVLATMWAKMLKAALAIPQTHVRHGALHPSQVAALLQELGLDFEKAESLAHANTAREIYDRLKAADHMDLIRDVCLRAQKQAEKWSELPVSVYLVTSEEGVVHHVSY